MTGFWDYITEERALFLVFSKKNSKILPREKYCAAFYDSVYQECKKKESILIHYNGETKSRFEPDAVKETLKIILRRFKKD